MLLCCTVVRDSPKGGTSELRPKGSEPRGIWRESLFQAQGSASARALGQDGLDVQGVARGWRDWSTGEKWIREVVHQ